MDDLIGRVVANTGVGRTAAEKAVSIILQFLFREGPTDKVRARFGMLSAIGGLMGAGTQLMAAGLSMGRIQALTRKTMRVVLEIAGEDAVGDIVGAIPGLGQLV
jgi:hypothetical protein